jgi:hypothetical protein
VLSKGIKQQRSLVVHNFAANCSTDAISKTKHQNEVALGKGSAERMNLRMTMVSALDGCPMVSPTDPETARGLHGRGKCAEVRRLMAAAGPTKEHELLPARLRQGSSPVATSTARAAKDWYSTSAAGARTHSIGAAASFWHSICALRRRRRPGRRPPETAAIREEKALADWALLSFCACPLRPILTAVQMKAQFPNQFVQHGPTIQIPHGPVTSGLPSRPHLLLCSNSLVSILPSSRSFYSPTVERGDVPAFSQLPAEFIAFACCRWPFWCR